jgi:hypothetical protein
VHPTARKCVQWAVVSAVVGAVLLVHGAEMLVALAELAGANAETGLAVVTVVLTLVSSLVFPMAAALVGAAVVVQALAPRGGHRGPADPDDVAQGGAEADLR